jgi:hypothetical protein
MADEEERGRRHAEIQQHKFSNGPGVGEAIVTLLAAGAIKTSSDMAVAKYKDRLDRKRETDAKPKVDE